MFKRERDPTKEEIGAVGEGPIAVVLVLDKLGFGEFWDRFGERPRERKVVVVVPTDAITWLLPRCEDDVCKIVEDGTEFWSVWC